MSDNNPTPCLMAFRNQRAPQRGTWVINSAEADDSFRASREITDENNAATVAEAMCLATIQEVRSFATTLIRQGWSACPAEHRN